MYTDPYTRMPTKPIVFKTTADFTNRGHQRSLPGGIEYLQQYLGGRHFIAAHSLGEVTGLSGANTSRLGGSLGNFVRLNPDTVGSMFSLPSETVLFCAADKRKKTTRHINVCVVAAVAIMGDRASSVPRIPGLGRSIVEPLLEGLVSCPVEVQQSVEELRSPTLDPNSRRTFL